MHNFLKNEKRIGSPRHLPKPSTWKCRLDILYIDTQLDSLKMKWIQVLLNPHQCSLERCHAVLIEFST